jgi:hypothetical protein
MESDFARRIGLSSQDAPNENRGNAALILFPDGKIQQSDDLILAMRYLKFLRSN